MSRPPPPTNYRPRRPSPIQTKNFKGSSGEDKENCGDNNKASPKGSMEHAVDNIIAAGEYFRF